MISSFSDPVHRCSDGRPGHHHPAQLDRQFRSRSTARGSGTTVALTVAAINATTYQWQLNGQNVSQGNASGATWPTLLLTGASSINAGSYTCVVGNANSSVTSNAVQLATVAEPVQSRAPGQSVGADAGRQRQQAADGRIRGRRGGRHRQPDPADSRRWPAPGGGAVQQDRHPGQSGHQSVHLRLEHGAWPPTAAGAPTRPP